MQTLREWMARRLSILGVSRAVDAGIQQRTTALFASEHLDLDKDRYRYAVMSTDSWTKGLETWLAAKCEEIEKRIEARYVAKIQGLETRIYQLEQADSLKGTIVGPTDIKVPANEQPIANDGSPTAADNINTLLSRRATPIRERLTTFTVTELRELCSDHDLPKTGVKAELIEKLATANVDPIEYCLIDLTRDDLRAACTARKLPLSGTKIDMARRLVLSP